MLATPKCFIIEKMVTNQLEVYFEKHKLLYAMTLRIKN